MMTFSVNGENMSLENCEYWSRGGGGKDMTEEELSMLKHSFYPWTNNELPEFGF